MFTVWQCAAVSDSASCIVWQCAAIQRCSSVAVRQCGSVAVRGSLVVCDSAVVRGSAAACTAYCVGLCGRAAGRAAVCAAAWQCGNITFRIINHQQARRRRGNVVPSVLVTTLCVIKQLARCSKNADACSTVVSSTSEAWQVGGCCTLRWSSCTLH